MLNVLERSLALLLIVFSLRLRPDKGFAAFAVAAVV